eukprot:m.482333 g.482333  ORF g.482333 m.482333 type:complete len:378 (+) comp22496_c0_seq1:370-1503(+)
MAAAFVLPALVAVATVTRTAEGHGAMVVPPSRNAVDRFLPEFVNGQFPQGTSGCNCGTRNGCAAGVRGSVGGQPCLWFSQGCNIGCPTCDGVTQHTNKSLCANPTVNATVNDPNQRTVNRQAVAGSEQDVFRFNPWRAPGFAPVVDSCGMAGGALHRGGGDAVFYTTQFAKQGDLGSKVLNPAPSGTTWRAGQTVEVAWGIRFNHGGGYQYRVCPASENLTEACFEKHPLAFVTGSQQLQWTNGTRESIAATYVTEGTRPAGAAWAMNPLPRINFDSTSSGQPWGASGCDMPAKGAACRQFDPPCKGDHGWAAVPGESPNSVDVEGLCSGDATGVMIRDQVVVPSDLVPGPYVVQWRWDCEETAQIWTNCGDVYVTN